MRKKIVAGNWKMNKTAEEAKSFFEELSNYTIPSNVVAIIIPSFPFLTFNFPPSVCKGAQNVSEYTGGAHTGEVSATMLQSVGVQYCIVGHSERRINFNEGNNHLYEKLVRLIENNIIPIFCIGETLEERNTNEHFDIIQHQLEPIFKFNHHEICKIIIAYEPVWAIGTGKTASKEQAEEMHSFIRNTIKEKVNPEISQKISILYGGSCNANNAAELFSMPNIDGGLIGGASLKVEDFVKIINAAC